MNGKQTVVISGPTGSGESTITNAILARFPNTRRLKTATSRPPRGEEKGDEYYFFSKEEFEQKIQSGEILEHVYHENRGIYYGTYGPDLMEKLAGGYVVLINQQIVGTRYFKEHYGATTIFIAPPSIEALMDRIRKRNPEMSEEELAKRRENAEEEMNDEQPFYDYTVVNADGKLDDAIEGVVAILTKEGYTLG